MHSLEFVPVFLPSCSSYYSSVERLWGCMKVHTRRHLGTLALTRKVDKIVIQDLRDCIQKGFDDVTPEQRRNLVKANYKDMLKAIEE